MKFYPAKNVHVIVPRAALTTIFDECDRYERDETGGKVVGVYQEKNGKLEIHVTGIIEPGPGARRSAVSLFQDGHYQEKVFRRIEASHPEIEHLGTWHTHHVNGLAHLSGGDIDTYQRTVNHPNQNTSFFYALLVTARNAKGQPWERFTVKHYLVRRDDERTYEIPQSHVEIVEEPLLWPATADALTPTTRAAVASIAKSGSASPLPNMQRVYDRDILSEFFGELRPFSSPKLGLYWRGPLELIDGSKVEIVLMETEGAHPSYSVLIRGAPEALKPVIDDLAQLDFPTARTALVATERRYNKALFELQNRLQKS